MKNKQEILNWFSEGNQDLRQSDYNRRAKELSDLLDSYRAEIVGSVPCEKATYFCQFRQAYIDGYNDKCDEVETWKKQQKGEHNAICGCDIAKGDDL